MLDAQVDQVIFLGPVEPELLEGLFRAVLFFILARLVKVAEKLGLLSRVKNFFHHSSVRGPFFLLGEFLLDLLVLNLIGIRENPQIRPEVSHEVLYEFNVLKLFALQVFLAFPTDCDFVIDRLFEVLRADVQEFVAQLVLRLLAE